MFSLFFLLNFFLCFLLFFSRESLRISFVKTLLTMSFLIFLFTEALSFFSKLTFISVVFCWVTSFLFLAVLFVVKYQKDFRKKLIQFKKVSDFFNKYKNEFYISLFFVFLIIIPLFFLALYFPPNNSDSLGYHLARVEHWIQNKSVSHYFANDIRQLIYQPFAEFIILHLRLLAGSDLWVNLVQFFAMLGSITLVTLLAQFLGLNYKFQILSAALALSIPMGIMQATTTQNDNIVSFFFLAFIYFGLLLIRKNKNIFSNVFFSAISLGLGFLTKATCAVFSFPFSVWFAFVLLKKYRKKAFSIGIFFLVCIFMINFPFWERNYSLSGNPFGENSTFRMMRNEKMGVSLFISNLIRNVSTHMAFPFGNRLFNRIVGIFHEKVLRVSVEEKSTTFCNMIYEPFFGMHEDYAGNFFFIFLLFFSLFYFFLNFKDLFFLIPYCLSLIGGYLLFSGLFKWQPWITRLDLPFFLGSVPFVSYVFYKIIDNRNDKIKRIAFYFILFLTLYWFFSFAIKEQRLFFVLLFSGGVLYFFVLHKIIKKDFLMGILFFSTFIFSIPYVYLNRKKLLLKNKKLLFASRELKYFGGNKKEQEKYHFIANVLLRFNINKVAIESGGCINEYFLWIALRNKIGPNIEIRHVQHDYKGLLYSKYKQIFFYRAVVSYLCVPLDHYNKNDVKFYKSLGTPKDPLSIIIFKSLRST